MIRNVLLTVVGCIALLLYILACRPSWSPDGSKLLVSYYDPDAQRAGVIEVDTTTGATRPLVVRVSTWDEPFVSGQWDDDGEHSIVRFAEHGFFVLPSDSSVPMRVFDLPESVEWTAFPNPLIGDHLFFSGDALVRVDLRTGDIVSRETDKELALYEAADRVFYLAEEDYGVEIGEVNQTELTFEPFFRLTDTELEQHGIDALTSFFAFEPGGRRFAFTARSERGAGIVVCTEAGLERVLVPRFPEEAFALGDINWSSTRDTFYLAAFTPTGDEDVTQVSIAEIGRDGALLRQTPLVEVQESLPDSDDGWDLAIQIALSPDESKIAVSTSFFEEEDLPRSERALFLVELEDPDRPITKILLQTSEQRSAR